MSQLELLGIPIDWTILAGINVFQIAVVFCALWVIVRLLMRFWPFLRKVMALTSALALLPTLIGPLGQLPDFMKTTGEALTAQKGKIEEIHASLNEQDEKIAEIHHETSYNNETSMKDALRRVELGVRGLYEQLGIAGDDRK